MAKLGFSLLITSIALLPSLSRADCGWSADRSFYDCTGVGYATSVGRALPQASDSIRFNPASIPTVLTPFGVEATYSSGTTSGDSKGRISLVKGFHRLGIGLSSWSQESFAAPKGLRHVEENFPDAYAQIPEASRTGFRAGSALGIPLGSYLSKYVKLNAGFSIGQAPKRGGLSKSLGATLDGGFLSLGYSKTEESINTLVPKTENTTLTTALTSGPIYLGYSRIRYKVTLLNPEASRKAMGLTREYVVPPLSIYSLRLSAKRIALYLAMKQGDEIDIKSGKKFSYASSAQFKVKKNLVLSYIYGLYEGKNSVSLQLYF